MEPFAHLLAHVAETDKAFDEAVVSVLKSIDKKGWAVFQVYDIKERLAAKGFEQKPLKIIEFCSAKHASGFLRKHPFVSLFMPCKISVLEDNGKVKILGMRPSIIAEFLTEISREEAEGLEKEIMEIINNAR